MKTSCPDGWKKVGRVCYMYVDNLKTWDNAQKYCKRRGGFLIEPDSDQKISSLKEHVLDAIYASSVWAGGKFEKTGGGWKGIWAGTNRDMVESSDNTFAFDSNYRELCTVMWRSSASLWDAECDGLSPFICEQKAK
ncbi:hypothetical protein DPMN_094571 [Dreissena polymorpha]|uniref:C-type lectin domain-containing protein n=1 Tax=Dreissena polymorpha TaxID=45954 RepID=A0A9D4R3N1_DREPO|nr:hypothetical protein DPMN_094571 [Dreissena polymorpha]